MSKLTDGRMAQLRLTFLAECTVNIALASQAISRLAQSATAESAISDLFRGVHSVKGGAGMFDLQRIADIAALMEDVAGQLARGSLQVSTGVLAALETGCQALEDFVDGANAGIEQVQDFELPHSGDS